MLQEDQDCCQPPASACGKLGDFQLCADIRLKSSGLKVFKINIDDDDQEVRLQVWFRRSWTDKRAVWNPVDFSYNCKRLANGVSIKDVYALEQGGHLWGFGGNNELAKDKDVAAAKEVVAEVDEQGVCVFSSGLYVKPDEVWIPDVIPLNSFANSDQVDATGIEVYPDGGRFYSRPMDIKFSDLNITAQNYPFDDQSVTLALGSWTYNENQMALAWTGTTTPGGQPAFGEGASESEITWQQCENRPCRNKCIKSKRRLMSGEVDETKLDRECKQLCKDCDTFGWASDDSFYFSNTWCRKGHEDTGICPIDFLRGTVVATGLGTLQNPVEWNFPGSWESRALGALPTWEVRKHIVLGNHSTKYPCCELPIPELEVRFTLERRAPYHLWLTIFPMVVLTQLGLVIHILQGKSVESINWALGTSFTILLALYAHNIFLAENVPLLPLYSFVNVIFLQSLIFTLMSAFFTIWRYARAHDLDGYEQ